MSDERWLPVVGYEGLYEVSDLGRVRLLDRMVSGWRGLQHKLPGRLSRARSLSRGVYRKVALTKNGVWALRPIHQLVLEAFVGPRPEGMVCCHNNGIGGDNRLANLRWDTPASNTADRVRHRLERLQASGAKP